MNTQNVLNQFSRLGTQTKVLPDGGRGDRYGARLGMCGIETRTSPEVYCWRGMDRGRSEFGIFQYTLKGEGRLQVNGADIRVSAGKAMLLHVPHPHVYSLPPGGEWVFMFITLLGRDVMPYWKRCCRKAQYCIEIPAQASVLQSACDLIQQVQTRFEAFDAEAAGMAYGFVMDLCHHLDMAEVDGEAAMDRDLLKAKGYAQEQFRKPIGVEDMAEAAGMSRSHFTRKFSRVEGLSPGRYLIRLRMKAAEDLLLGTSLSVSDVAAQAGFSDLNYFCRAFRKYYGVTPGAFRVSGLFGK